MRLETLSHFCSVSLWQQTEHMPMSFTRKTQDSRSFILTDAEAPHFTHVSPEIGKRQVVIEMLARDKV